MRRNNRNPADLARFQKDVKLEGTRRFCELIIQDLDIQIMRVDRLLEMWQESRQVSLVEMRHRLVELRQMCQAEQTAAENEIHNHGN